MPYAELLPKEHIEKLVANCILGVSKLNKNPALLTSTHMLRTKPGSNRSKAEEPKRKRGGKEIRQTGDLPC